MAERDHDNRSGRWRAVQSWGVVALLLGGGQSSHRLGQPDPPGAGRAGRCRRLRSRLPRSRRPGGGQGSRVAGRPGGDAHDRQGRGCVAAAGRVAAHRGGLGLPRDGDRVAKLRWREAIAQAWPYEPLQGLPAALDIAVDTALSFKDLLKPIIDGLEPVLGRDPRGHLELSPNDHLITWLRVLRSPGPPTLRLQLATA